MKESENGSRGGKTGKTGKIERDSHGKSDRSNELLSTLINLCDDLAWGRPANEDQLFRFTRQDAGPPELVRLAEAFGMMLVKVGGRELRSADLVQELQARNAELEEARRQLVQRNANLMRAVQETWQPRKVLGQCEAMRKVMKMALSISNRPINTLILGATGTGKEVVARLIHFNSPRREGPFIAVNCTAIPDSLFESELFGIEKGVATGVGFRRGLMEEANGGTLFLDEIGEMTLANQAKLLRALESREIMRVGGSRTIALDINVISATNVELLENARSGKFREDLYYRINVAEIRLPPLAERGDDILLLAQMFLEQHCSRMGRGRLMLSPEVHRLLLDYPWPGNVRELNNEMERAAALTLGEQVMASDLSPRILASASGCGDLSAISAPDAVAVPENSQVAATVPEADGKILTLQEMEKRHILSALQQARGNRSQAAALLGITREGLRKKLLRMGKNDDAL